MHRQPHWSITAVSEHRHGRLAPDRRALFGDVMNLALPAARLHAIGESSPRVLAHELLVAPAQQFAGVVTETAVERGGGFEYCAIGRLHQDYAVIHIVHDDAVQAQYLLLATFCRDVEQGGVEERLASVDRRRRGADQPDMSPIAVVDAQLGYEHEMAGVTVHTLQEAEEGYTFAGHQQGSKRHAEQLRTRSDE